MEKTLYFFVALFTFDACVTGYTASDAANIEKYRCPANPKNIVMFIDACSSKNADYSINLGYGKCGNTRHADETILTYKAAGGHKKVWLMGFDYEHLYTQYPFAYSIDLARKCGVKRINISAGGKDFQFYEKLAVARFIYAGGKIFAAAGNSHTNIDLDPYYPASYAGVIAVGAKACLYSANYSNYGSKVTHWYCGESAVSNGTGTSFATPRATAAEENSH